MYLMKRHCRRCKIERWPNCPIRRSSRAKPLMCIMICLSTSFSIPSVSAISLTFAMQAIASIQFNTLWTNGRINLIDRRSEIVATWILNMQLKWTHSGCRHTTHLLRQTLSLRWTRFIKHQIFTCFEIVNDSSFTTDKRFKDVNVCSSSSICKSSSS